MFAPHMSRNTSGGSATARKSSLWPSHLRNESSGINVERRSLEPPKTPDTISSNSTVKEQPSAKKTKPGRTCTAHVNESASTDEVLMNLDLLDKDIKPGSLMSIAVLEPDRQPGKLGGPGYHASMQSATGPTLSPNLDKRYLFTVKDMPTELKKKYPNVEIYVLKPIADAFGIKKTSQVLLTSVGQSHPC